MSTTCAAEGCDKPGTLKCSKCGEESYCSSDCQLSNWKIHRKTCGKGSPSKSPAAKAAPSSSEKASSPAPAANVETVTASSPTTPSPAGSMVVSGSPDSPIPAGPGSPQRIQLDPELIQQLQQRKEACAKAFGTGNLPDSVKLGGEMLEFCKTLPAPIAISESCQVHLNLCSAFLQMKNLEQAERHSQACIKLAELAASQRPDNPHAIELVLMANGSRSFVFLSAGKLVEANDHAQKALMIAEKLYPKNDPRLFKPLRGVAIIREREGKHDEAEKLFFRAYSVLSMAGKAASRDAQMTLDELINMLMRKNTKEDCEKAERYAATNFKSIGDKQDPKDSMVFGDAAARVAAIGVKLGKFAACEELMQLCLKIRSKFLKPDDLGIAYTLIQLSGTQEAQGKNGMDIEANLLRALEIFNAKQGPNSPEATKTMNSLRMLRARRQQAKGGGGASAGEDDDGTVVTGESTPATRAAAAVAKGVANAANSPSSSSGNTIKADPSKAAPYDAEVELKKVRSIGMAPDDGDRRMAFAHKFFEMARYNCAEVMINEAHEIYLRKLGPDHPQTQQANSNLGVVRNNHINKLWMEVLDETSSSSISDGFSESKSSSSSSSSSSPSTPSAPPSSASLGASEYEQMMAKANNAKLPFATEPVSQSGCIIC